MKDNIDLTIDRDFEKKRNIDIVGFAFHRRLAPWHINNLIDGSDSFCENEIVLTGNKEKRMYKRMAMEEESGEFCLRCGRRIYPYSNYFFGLCQSCDYELQKEIRRELKIPWLNADVSSENSTNPLHW